MRIFDRLHEQGRTIILITHKDELAAHARRVIRVRDGLIVEVSGEQYAAEVAGVR